jgi:molybdopterin synthase catalytic subunit
VSLTAIRESQLSLDEVRAAVAGATAGGIALFAGTVRDNDHGQGVTGLSYTAHPSAEAELRRVAEAIAEKFPVLRVAIVHRVGDLAVGDLAVVAAVSAPHRAEAFDACRELIEQLKATVPLWKHQRFTDGTDEWVGTT